MSTDKLLELLPSFIGNNPSRDINGNIIGYKCEKPTDSIQHLQLIKEKNSLYTASYGRSGYYVCLNPDGPVPYNNAVAYGSTPNEALMGLYNWCKENGFI